ncbi:hypothetical protein BPAE_0026g00010 [Botrytis paeoniae]|uniref:Uncharacterized protein n=1 Tax=Botrytis paeoniae TaxID=278948 RepID=A0A4Z1G2F4_9HELO|nr:hypothetical protein BPAE_0026g00010 [Botrytis paeoniae]
MKLPIPMLMSSQNSLPGSRHLFPNTDSNPRRYFKCSRSINCYARFLSAVMRTAALTLSNRDKNQESKEEVVLNLDNYSDIVEELPYRTVPPYYLLLAIAISAIHYHLASPAHLERALSSDPADNKPDE